MITPTEAVNAFYEGIIRKNIDTICAAYVPSESTYVVLEGPRYTTLGYEKITKGWRDFCASPVVLTKITWVEGPFEQVSAGMGFVAGQIVLEVEVNKKVLDIRFRATFVLVSPEKIWQITHEHVSGPLSDPYGIGDWLKNVP